MNLSVIIPAYREGPKLAELITKIKETTTYKEIIVVVDDIDDPSLEYCPNERIILNQSGGFAKAIETGLLHARGKYSAIVMADGSDELIKIKEGANQLDNCISNIDIYCPTRYNGGEMVNSPFIKTICSKTVNWIAHHIKGVPTTDATNAFKVYRTKSAVQLLPLRSEKFEVTLELCLKASKAGMIFRESPTVWTERSEGTSKFNLLKLMWGYIRLLLN